MTRLVAGECQEVRLRLEVAVAECVLCWTLTDVRCSTGVLERYLDSLCTFGSQFIPSFPDSFALVGRFTGLEFDLLFQRIRTSCAFL